MCGLAGYISNNPNKEIIKKMTDKIKHRGPDGEGFYVDDNIALGHRRLAIIDIEAGSQPMYNEEKTLVVVFNGEIYNYKDLKKQLEKKGHKFQTNSDTEVLLHGYEEYKNDLPKKLRGMFAFSIWDIENKTLFCARDHFGIKPFYYYSNNNTFMFGSEIKSLLEHPDFKKKLNKELIAPYLWFNFTPTTETLFKNVYRLNPGYSLTYKDGEIELDRYFKVTFDVLDKEFQEVVNDIEKVMEDSVNHHMISDVEVGSFLSSGIDSSYLVSLAKPDKTYTVGYDIPKYNEIEYAKDLTDKLNITNISKKITKEEYMNIIPDIMYYMDEPLADPAAVSLYFVAKLASEDVKVVLSGEGADELFGGYNYYRKDVDLGWYNKIPFKIRYIIGKIASLFGERKGVNFLVRRGQTLEESYIGVNKVFSKREANKMLKEKSNINPKDITKYVYKEHKDDDDLLKMQAIDINFWLIKDILQKADRMTMANSLEGRVPFIDTEVFKVARTLTEDNKVTKENTKVALRAAAKKVIPNESYKKKKLGFPVPLRDWIKEDDFYNQILTEFKSNSAKELFNQKEIIKLLDDHKNNKKDNYKKVWTIYTFLVWYNKFFVS